MQQTLFENKQVDSPEDKAIHVHPLVSKPLLLHGDCLLKLRSIPDSSIDLIITDPPYGVNFTKGYKSGNKELVHGDDGFSVMIFVDEIAKEFARVLKPDSACYVFTRFDVFPYWWLKLKNHLDPKNQIIWNKGGGGMGDLKGNFAFDYESIIYAAKGKPTIREKRIGSVWNVKKCKQEFHETQKPVELIEKIITHSSDVGDVVLDPYMGSGTTGVACAKMKRNFVGIELNDTSYQIATKRIEAC